MSFFSALQIWQNAERWPFWNINNDTSVSKTETGNFEIFCTQFELLLLFNIAISFEQLTNRKRKSKKETSRQSYWREGSFCCCLEYTVFVFVVFLSFSLSVCFLCSAESKEMVFGKAFLTDFSNIVWRYTSEKFIIPPHQCTTMSWSAFSHHFHFSINCIVYWEAKDIWMWMVINKKGNASKGEFVFDYLCPKSKILFEVNCKAAVSSK